MVSEALMALRKRGGATLQIEKSIGRPLFDRSVAKGGPMRKSFVLAALASITLASTQPAFCRYELALDADPQPLQHDQTSLSKPVEGPDLRLKMPNKHPRLVVALGGGGCKAVAEIGVLRSLEKNHIPIDGIVGSSMGATIGALYCSGMPLDDIEKLFLSGAIPKSLSDHVRLKVMLQPFTAVAHLVLPKPYAGLTSGTEFHHLLEKNLPPTFSDLKIPFAAVATDITDGRTTVLSEGNLPRAILASNTVPPLYRPVLINGTLYVDGGIKANMPARIAQTKMDADVVVGVAVDTAIKREPNEKYKKLKNVIGRVTDIILAEVDAQQAKNTDIFIYPNADDIPLICNKKELMERGVIRGQVAADQKIPAILSQLGNMQTAATEDSAKTPR